MFDVWQAQRPKGRPPRWAFRVALGGRVVFESAWVAVRYRTRNDAVWLAARIDALAGSGRFFGSPGHPVGTDHPQWLGRRANYDDWSLTVGDLYCHAEHMAGPFHGGLWYCQVSRGTEALFHTAIQGIEPRSGEAARWLCEVMVRAALAGNAEGRGSLPWCRFRACGGN